MILVKFGDRFPDDAIYEGFRLMTEEAYYTWLDHLEFPILVRLGDQSQWYDDLATFAATIEAVALGDQDAALIRRTLCFAGLDTFGAFPSPAPAHDPSLIQAN